MYNWINYILSVGQSSISTVLRRPLGTSADGAPRKLNLLISVMVRPNFSVTRAHQGSLVALEEVLRSDRH